LLHDARGADSREAWAEFIAAHSGILLHTCRRMARDHDAAMDGYAYVLEALSEDGYRRLRAYKSDGKTRFTTWLVVVTRRLLLDRHRQRYGRPRSEDTARRSGHDARRRLEDFVAAEVDPDQLTSTSSSRPDLEIRRRELADALRDAIEELDPADRLVLALRFEDRRTAREIARMLKLPTVFHAYRRITAVLATLRGALQRRGIDTSEP